jgi:hypothetical protein
MNRTCSGRIYLSADCDENDGGYQCPDCGRIVMPSVKRTHRSLRLSPDLDAMSAAVVAQLVATHLGADHRDR